MTREEFESIQRKFQESGLGIMQFLRQEKINHSTFSKWRRRCQAENLEVVKPEETLATVSISHTNCNNVIQPTSRLTVIFPNGVKVYVPDFLYPYVRIKDKGNARKRGFSTNNWCLSPTH